jgi:hypothetical protein
MILRHGSLDGLNQFDVLSRFNGKPDRTPVPEEFAQEPVAFAPGLVKTFGPERDAKALLGQRGGVRGIMDKPRPVVIPKVMPRIRGIHPN